MSRWVRIGGCMTIAMVAVAFLAPSPASADSFYMSYSSGYGHRHHRHHRHHHHHHWPHYRYSYYHYAPPVYYAPPPPRVVYVPTPPPPLAATPTSPPYRAANGQYCREYQATVTVNGVPQPSYGTACLQPDGTWRVVN